MTDEPTCGRGLAASAALPGKIAELSAALAEVLERHMKALDMAAMADPAMGAAFERFVRREEELLQLLQSRLDDDRVMLSTMRDEGDWAS